MSSGKLNKHPIELTLCNSISLSLFREGIPYPMASVAGSAATSRSRVASSRVSMPSPDRWGTARELSTSCAAIAQMHTAIIR